MANTELQNLDTAAAWSSTCSLAGSDSAFPTQSFKFPKALFDAIYPTLALGGTFADGSVLALNVNARILFTNGGIHITNVALDNLFTVSDQGFAWGSGGAGINKVSSGGVEINNGTAGVLAEIRAKGLPFIVKVANVDLTTTAIVDILTVPAGASFILTDCWFNMITVTTFTVTGNFAMWDSGSGSAISSGPAPQTTVAAGNYVMGVRSGAGTSKPLVTAGNKVQLNKIAGATAAALVADVYIQGFYLFT